jgi:Protein of unknown function (DUF3144)
MTNRSRVCCATVTPSGKPERQSFTPRVKLEVIMQTDKVPKEFFDVADEFVRLANKLNEKWPSSRISSAMMYATARYNAFNYYTLEPKPEDNFEKAIDFFCKEYRSMLLENVRTLKSLAGTKGGK